MLYDLALQQKDTCNIIRAKQALDGTLLGVVILMLSPSSKLADLFPAIGGAHSGAGAILCPVVSSLAGDRSSLTQGLVLLGVRQLKRQGASAVYLDNVSSHAPGSSWNC